MRPVNVKEARENLKRLLDAVAGGEEILVLRRGKQIARLVPPRRKGTRLPVLKTFRASMKVRGKPTSAEVRRSRDQERY